MQSNITIRQALNEAISQLKAISPSAIVDARILMQYLLGYSLEQLISLDEQLLSSAEYQNLQKLIYQRQNGMPVAYIIGQKEFYGRQFIVNTNVLIPRADTEILVTALLNDYSDTYAALSVLELGVGSGCVIISILLERPNFVAVAVDNSAAALMVSRDNAAKFAIETTIRTATTHTADINTVTERRLNLLQSDWFSSLLAPPTDTIADCKFDIIIANPPYICTSEIALMTPETLKFEPHNALFAENNGLIHYQTIANEALNYLNDDGRVYLEIGFKQQTAVETIFTAAGYQLLQVHHDYASHPRVLCFKAL